jgi:hypothetical protein
MKKKQDWWHSEEMSRNPAHWDDPWARAYRVTSATTSRYAIRKASLDPFVYQIGHGPNHPQESPPLASERRPDLGPEDLLALAVGFIAHRQDRRTAIACAFCDWCEHP